MVSVETMIAELPPYKDEWQILHDDQKVKDIINEIIISHEDFTDYYDRIAYHFDAKDEYKIAEKIVDFLGSNVKYKEETDKDQTTAIPTGILIRGTGDCKHYSSFAAGVLDALKREGKKINWCYRFASYRILDKTPHHVFVVINPGGNEIWIDPTPNADRLTPVWQVDKKVNTMLRKNIAGIEYLEEWEEIPTTIGMATITVTPAVNVDMLNFDGKGTYKDVFKPYLALSDYRDYSGERNFNADQTAAQLNQLIASGPQPGHQVTADFVKWVYDASIRSWNFYYPWGVKPGFTAENLMPPGWPKLVITPDLRLTLDHDVQLDDFRNAGIQLLTAWAQSLIAQYDTTPYPVKPRHIKEFSQNYTGNPNNPNANLFNEARGASFIKEIGQALENVLNVVKEGVLKIVGSIPRNAFLVLVGLNIFNLAKKLQDKITAGQWDQMSKRWQSLGGNPDKLLSTINHGKDKPEPAINEQSTETIGEPLTAAAMIAAAAPIIAAMLAFIPDPEGKLHNVLQATKAAAGTIWPDLDLDAYGFLDKTTGKRYDFVVDDIDNENFGGGNDDLPTPGGPGSQILDKLKKNPMITAAAVGAGVYFIPKKKNLVLAGAAALATYLYLNKSVVNQLTLTTAQKLTAIKTFSPNESPASLAIFDQMTADEINSVYSFLFNYVKNNLTVPDGDLKTKILAISNKYNIFT